MEKPKKTKLLKLEIAAVFTLGFTVGVATMFAIWYIIFN